MGTGCHLRKDQRGVPVAGHPAALGQLPFFGSWAFMPTTARSTSTTRWPRCWTNCGWSSPSHAPAIPTTTAWRRPERRGGPQAFRVRAYSPTVGQRGQRPLPDFLNPYLNFHRPCLFPESVTDAQGKTRKRYPLDGVMTPFEKLKSIPAMVSFLKPSITLDSLEIESKRLSDNDAAEQFQQAKQQLFLSIHNRSKVAA